MLIYEDGQTPTHGGVVTLPRLALSYYWGLAVILLLVCIPTVFALRKRKAVNYAVMAALLPLSYILSQLCVKGTGFRHPYADQGLYRHPAADDPYLCRAAAHVAAVVEETACINPVRHGEQDPIQFVDLQPFSDIITIGSGRGGWLMENIILNIRKVCDLQPVLRDDELVNIAVGPDGGYYILAVDSSPPFIKGYPQIRTTRRYHYKAIILKSDHWETIPISHQDWNYHYLQPLGDRLLVACARSEYHGPGQYDMNARIFDRDGSLVDEFLLGDGIEDIQVTSQGKIWTSYFDEGIAGNLSWEEPIGSCGLRAWSPNGEPIFCYNGRFMTDCYALNVVGDDEIWFYYYTDFLLARLRDGRIDYFEPGIRGSDGFLVSDQGILMRGGYDDNDEYYLFSRTEEILTEQAVFTVHDENNSVIKADHVACRGTRLLLEAGGCLYAAELSEFVAGLDHMR